jgi:hypothetical protein
MARKEDFPASILIMVVVFGCLIGYLWMADRGWISRANRTSVIGFPTRANAKQPVRCKTLRVGEEDLELDCRANANERAVPALMKVRFWGSAGQGSLFNCEHWADSVVCRAVPR